VKRPHGHTSFPTVARPAARHHVPPTGVSGTDGSVIRTPVICGATPATTYAGLPASIQRRKAATRRLPMPARPLTRLEDRVERSLGRREIGHGHELVSGVEVAGVIGRPFVRGVQELEQVGAELWS
jgi:hypothetical protein